MYQHIATADAAPVAAYWIGRTRTNGLDGTEAGKAETSPPKLDQTYPATAIPNTPAIDQSDDDTEAKRWPT